MLTLATPRGLPADVPETLEEDPSSRFAVSELVAAKAYYDEFGYVIITGLLAPDACDRARALWEAEVKPFNGHIYRQATAKAERHRKNGNGWVMNPILNLQSIDPKRFGALREFATQHVLAAPQMKASFTALLGEAPKIVQSMYFEGNSATWEHQDSYYLDSEKIGEMCAAWVALEDIHASAGRFFICPRSHRIRLQDHSLTNNIAEHHEDYILSVVEEIKRSGLEIRAPLLKKGDVLFWNSLTIHGSLNSQDARHSRSSITCHAIPLSSKFLQLQTRVMDVVTDDVNGVAIHRPKDLARFRNRAVLWVESHFPRQFYWLKKKAILLMIRLKSG
jgi:phytanoyl-CoA hydroxylase